MNKTIKIAVDGHSSCGKSTLAKDLAKYFDFLYIDTGAMYRAVTLFAIRKGVFKNDKENYELLLKNLSEINIEFKQTSKDKTEIYLNGENVEYEIRNLEVSSKVSPIATVPEVRTLLVDLQRKMSENKSVVMDGRDIGTVVFPNAEVKLFVTADVETRAKRRFDELKQKNIDVDYESIFKNITERDFIDQNREVSPLKMAEDAILIDNSKLTIKQQLDLAVKIIKEKIYEN
ncbi:MAG: (d)CMP kinase [Bacteroidota bacterium]|jgi:cytidylate kinase|nr:(d)CMP kinase [Bacteroidales bacterium]MDI9535124.1 (d)CMP kinase [Bacteroidota bacterium]OQC45529.1 MAG: Cytidylate kinase [Bacteroidetes bacterium ADurb.Bin028]HNY43914.1 (d)CMP kinase [Bacteroidales bacterium]HOD88505.1 (d)CMP kinase [Bacteroidales bacterium]